MATEVFREDFGMTDKGAVVIVGKESYDDSGERKVYTYEVRHGVHTVAEGITYKRANDLAQAIADQAKPVRGAGATHVMPAAAGGSDQREPLFPQRWASY
jgi:hypothetical protein